MPVPGWNPGGLSVFSKPELEPSLEDELRMVDTPGFAASGGSSSWHCKQIEHLVLLIIIKRFTVLADESKLTCGSAVVAVMFVTAIGRPYCYECSSSLGWRSRGRPGCRVAPSYRPGVPGPFPRGRIKTLLERCI